MTKRMETKKIVMIAVFSAIAYVCTYFRFPIFPVADFLKYDSKDIIIAIAGFAYSPIAAILVSVISSLLEMITVSTTGVVGLLMNVVSSCAFACFASLVYKYNKNLKGAVLGLVGACISMTAVMVLWNIFITPAYMNVDRSIVMSMLLPVFIPFNLLKSIINASATMVLYKPCMQIFRKSGILPQKEGESHPLNIKVMLISVTILLLAITVCLLYIYKIL